MLNQEQKAYIDNLKVNYADTTEEVLVETLRGAGWSETEVAAAVKRFYNVEEVLPPPPRPTASSVVVAPEKTLETPEKFTEEVEEIEKAEDLAQDSISEEINDTTVALAPAVAATPVSQTPELSDYEKARQKRLEQEAKVTQFLNEDDEAFEQNTNKTNKTVVSFLAGLVILIIGFSGASIWWLLQKSGGGVDNISTLTNENILEFFVRKGLLKKDNGNFIGVSDMDVDIEIGAEFLESFGLAETDEDFNDYSDYFGSLFHYLFLLSRDTEMDEFHKIDSFPLKEGSLTAKYHGVLNGGAVSIDKGDIKYSMNNIPQTISVDTVKTDDQYFSRIRQASDYNLFTLAELEGLWIQTSLETLPADKAIITKQMMPLLAVGGFGESAGLLDSLYGISPTPEMEHLRDIAHNEPLWSLLTNFFAEKDWSGDKIKQIKIIQDFAKKQDFIKVISSKSSVGKDNSKLTEYNIQFLGSSFLAWCKDLKTALDDFNEPLLQTGDDFIESLKSQEAVNLFDFLADKLVVKVFLNKDEEMEKVTVTLNSIVPIRGSERLGGERGGKVDLSLGVEYYNIGRPQLKTAPERYITVDEAAKIIGYTDNSLKLTKQRNNIQNIDGALIYYKNYSDYCIDLKEKKDKEPCVKGQGEFPGSLAQIFEMDDYFDNTFYKSTVSLKDSFTGQEYEYESDGKDYSLKYHLEFIDTFEEGAAKVKYIIDDRFIEYPDSVLDIFGVDGENTMTNKTLSVEADASVKDSDGDGVSDRLEKLYGLNPYSDDGDYEKINDLYYEEHLDSGW